MRRLAQRSALAALASFAVPLAAQQAAAPAQTQRIVATYDFKLGQRDAAFPRSVTLSDSAGTLVAHALNATTQRAVPLAVTIMQSDLILQGETTDGMLTMILNRANEGGSTYPAGGIWTLGDRHGTLAARKQR
jgi:hypothetical protein